MIYWKECVKILVINWKEYSMSQNNCYCNGIYFSFFNNLKNKLNAKKFNKKKKKIFL